MEKRLDYRIVNLRAIAIITVVLGHSIILYSSKWNLYSPAKPCVFLHYVKEVINLYQLPLFFSLSGFLFAKSQNRQRFFGRFFMNKAKRLLIPFLFFGLFYMIPIRLALHYPGYQGKGYLSAVKLFLNGMDQGHLWFLSTLFLFFVVSWALFAIAGKNKLSWAILFVAAVLLKMIKINSGAYINYIKYFAAYYWSFVFGALISFLPVKRSSARLAVLSVVTAFVSLFTVWKDIPYTIVASILILIWFYLIIPDKQNGLLSKISEESYGIYLLHSPLIYITFTFFGDAGPVFVTIINFVLFGTVAYLLSRGIGKTKLRFLLGQ